MIASLPMYAGPDLKQANADFWALIRENLITSGIIAPDNLVTPPDLWTHWQAPDLLLSQTCGLPYRAKLWDQVKLIGTPDYGLKDCPPGHYYSVIIARDTAPLAGRTFAFNDPMSQSGWAALAGEAPALLTGPLLETGSHAASVQAVRDGQADFASIDAVTWRHLDQTGLHLRGRTQPSPGLPFITAKTHDTARLFDAISKAIAQLGPSPLGLMGLVAIPPATYLALPLPASPPLR